jgi:succinate dehydrogenase (ubiquinone) cytochrome b560 subunit
MVIIRSLPQGLTFDFYSLVATQPTSASEGQSILEQQRLRRPVSPHLDIYDFKQTYLSGSIWQRFTGGAMGGAMYAFGAAYLVAPLVGWHLETPSLVAAFATLPVFVKGGFKFVMAWPFAYHFLNGIKHLTYDLAIGFTRPQIKQANMVVWTLATVSSLGLLFL